MCLSMVSYSGHDKIDNQIVDSISVGAEQDFDRLWRMDLGPSRVVRGKTFCTFKKLNPSIW